MSVTDRNTSAAADRGGVGAGAEPSGAAQPAGRLSPMRTGLATVCISGTLEDKLTAAGDAGFDGVEIFEPDFVASSMTAAQVRDRCADLGLTIDLYQPFRDFDTTRAGGVEHNLRRLDRKFDIMAELGTDLILVCSAVSPDAVHDDDVLVEQLSRAAELAQRRGMRVSYEALAWGSYVNTYEHSWDLVRRVDAPALGLCLDSFHILSRGSDPAGIESIPTDKIFFLQLADAPHLTMDVLQWSRHHRLFPGQGAFDLVAFLRHVLAAGYRGPLSLEVFNDVFRQSDPQRSALDALRSLLVLQEQALPVPASGPVPAGGPGAGRFRLRRTRRRRPEGRRRHPDPRRTRAAQHRPAPQQAGRPVGVRLGPHPGQSDPGAERRSEPVTHRTPARRWPHSAWRRRTRVRPCGGRTRYSPTSSPVDAGPAEADLAAVAAPDGHRDLPVPHRRCARRLATRFPAAGRFGVVRRSSARSRRHHRRGPCRTHPAVRPLRRGFAVLRGDPRSAHRAQLGDRGTVRPGPQPCCHRPAGLGADLPVGVRAAPRRPPGGPVSPIPSMWRSPPTT